MHSPPIEAEASRETDMAKTTENTMPAEGCVEWVEKFEAGKSVFTIEMGGLGPGYEQALQLSAFRIARHLIDAGYSAKDFNDDNWRTTRDKIEKAVKVDDLGLSGAQWGAAMQLATRVYMVGEKAVHDPKVKDRLIQVSTNWPGSLKAEG